MFGRKRRPTSIVTEHATAGSSKLFYQPVRRLPRGYHLSQLTCVMVSPSWSATSCLSVSTLACTSDAEAPARLHR
jgi:hypothetical protein